MEMIGQQKLWTFLDGKPGAQTASVTTARTGPGHRVRSFVELATKIAELQFRNNDYVLLFRGQGRDYRNQKGLTSLKTSLFRGSRGNPGEGTLQRRFEILESAERLLSSIYAREEHLGKHRLARTRLVRWAILQHYEVCPTPLLDVTHSLRIAASFATHGAANESFIFVLGVPYLGGGMTASAEAGLQAIRLSSVCPPSAVRPHLQEGYLLGEYPEMSGFQQKTLYPHFEMDFGRRLIAKFRFDPREFWSDPNFPLVEAAALYPSKEHDPLLRLSLEIKDALPKASVKTSATAAGV
ncbi:FRG domain-containing protein [Paraburkholderia caribensis]|uniref:FRG domain-containing protein n=1 Tax=Paraburkholderia TaxID=1822464 RepID=UPI001CB59824|nr:FRG domain-containing protein [Paraburkholderia caribensis]BEU25801.1 FRG domain-containing protein [Paraburkholderia sp. 22B1P]CAG9250940.1 FRG domain-containing protein [Paraburkholderia caribensis]